METVVRTGVDDLMDFLKGKEKLPLFDVADALKVSPDIVQSWVDFLVEEGLVGIEYKFTKPFIFLLKPEKGTAKVTKEGELGWETFRRAFMAKARDRSIPEGRAQDLWSDKVIAAVDMKRSFFNDEARKRQLADIDALWNEYRNDVLKKV